MTHEEFTAVTLTYPEPGFQGHRSFSSSLAQKSHINLTQRYYVTFRYLPLQICLSVFCLSLTFVHRFQGVEAFGKDSLPLNAAREAWGSEGPSVVQRPSSGRGSGGRSPETLKLFPHFDIIFCIFSPMQDLASTDFCSGKFGTLASRGHGPLPILYPPLRKVDNSKIRKALFVNLRPLDM